MSPQNHLFSLTALIGDSPSPNLPTHSRSVSLIEDSPTPAPNRLTTFIRQRSGSMRDTGTRTGKSLNYVPGC